MVVGAALVTLWALRLFRAHGRRYQWALSSKEDWRRADLREAFGPRWFGIASLPVAFIAEQGAACARCLPLRSLAGFAGAGVPFLPSFEDESDDVAALNVDAPLGLADGRQHEGHAAIVAVGTDGQIHLVLCTTLAEGLRYS